MWKWTVAETRARRWERKSGRCNRYSTQQWQKRASSYWVGGLLVSPWRKRRALVFLHISKSLITPKQLSCSLHLFMVLSSESHHLVRMIIVLFPSLGEWKCWVKEWYYNIIYNERKLRDFSICHDCMFSWVRHLTVYFSWMLVLGNIT